MSKIKTLSEAFLLNYLKHTYQEIYEVIQQYNTQKIDSIQLDENLKTATGKQANLLYFKFDLDKEYINIGLDNYSGNFQMRLVIEKDKVNIFSFSFSFINNKKQTVYIDDMFADNVEQIFIKMDNIEKQCPNERITLNIQEDKIRTTYSMSHIYSDNEMFFKLFHEISKIENAESRFALLMQLAGAKDFYPEQKEMFTLQHDLGDSFFSKLDKIKKEYFEDSEIVLKPNYNRKYNA